MFYCKLKNFKCNLSLCRTRIINFRSNWKLNQSQFHPPGKGIFFKNKIPKIKFKELDIDSYYIKNCNRLIEINYKSRGRDR